MKEKSKNSSINMRSLIAGFSGNILEWYDFTVYGFFATVIGAQFFPDEDKVVQLISAFGIFAAGYLMRPIGGIIFGHIGDRQGRKKALLYSILLMAIPTTLIGFLPTYADIGWYSALLLVLLRLLQGLSVGGEFTGSISFLVEKAPKGKRGFFGSWSTFGVFGGMLLGSGLGSIITSILSTEQLHDFGWRIPFLFGAVIGIVGLYLRKGMGEEEHFEEANKEQSSYKTPLAEFWASYKLQALKIMLLSWAFGVSVYLIFIFLPSYLHTFHQVKLDDALSAHTITLIVLMLMIPLFGHLTDKIGRKTVLFLSLLGFIIFSYPLFALMFENTFEAILIAMLVFAVFEAMFQAVMPALMTESFPAKVRYTGLSISYNFSLAIFGGTTPLVCTWLVKQSGGDVWMPVYYLMASCVIGVIVALFIPETYKKELE
ncbi:MFS transporter [Lentimicrobium sp. S6]|uniref:MFS transporter n=3 Tax=unclassified Lentimicrobium TaxID=2677434 RepID=UPI001556AA40|nr:MFS transporter [Lentimicrobium sp. S6]NPD44382.1 MFS transporter [Lentimicrobium sp. S6]